MAVPPHPGSTGGLLWDQAVQGGDHPAQIAVPMIPGGPEGVVCAPIGYLCSDELGNAYVKKTDVTLATGWCQLICVTDLITFFGEFFPN